MRAFSWNIAWDETTGSRKVPLDLESQEGTAIAYDALPFELTVAAATDSLLPQIQSNEKSWIQFLGEFCCLATKKFWEVLTVLTIVVFAAIHISPWV